MSWGQEKQSQTFEKQPEKFLFTILEEVGMSSDSLAKIESFVMEYMKEQKFPGVNLLTALVESYRFKSSYYEVFEDMFLSISV